MKHVFERWLHGKLFLLRGFSLLILCFVSVAFVKAEEIKGKVVDVGNEPLIGVSIVVKNTPRGTITDLDGNFTLNVDAATTLVFTYMGYQTEEVVVGAQKFISLTMKEDAQQLDEVVVVGYGTMKKKDLTGALGTVNADQLAKEQPATTLDLLRSNVPGLSMGIATDAKGNAENIMIRGKNSLRSDAKTTPLFVLDGVIYDGELTDINPQDIERIDVLKDASSAAVYGAKAANGVILITTKKGKAGKPVIKFSSVLTAAFPKSLPEVYKGEQYIAYRQAVLEAQNLDKPGGFYENPMNLANRDLAAWMAMSNATGDPIAAWFTRLNFSDIERDNYLAGNVLDWQDLTYQTAFNQDYTVSVSGKNDNVSYYTSFNYLNNESNVVGGGYSAIRARLNLEAKATDFLSFGVNTQFTSRDESYISAGGYQALSPYGSLYEDDGKTYKYYPNDNPNGYNPFIDRHYTIRSDEYNILNSAFYLKLSLPWGFSIQSTYSPRYQWRQYLNHKSTKHPLWGDIKDTATRTSSKRLYWQWDNMLKWNKEFGLHSLDFTFLANLEKLQTWSETMKNSGFQPSDVLGPNGIQWGTNPEVTSDDQYSTGDALMGRLHYVYDNKYLITGTVRRDGYSAFGGANPHAVFPSVALGWVFTEEKFFPKNDVFNYGKLRLSWGLNGNRDIGIYNALMMLEARKYAYIDPSTGEFVPINTYYAYRMANNLLKWENTGSYNIGLDFSLLKDRLSGSIDLYQKKTRDQLIRRKLIDVTGYNEVWSNIGEVQNTGFEISLNSTNIKRKNFTWNTSFGVSYNKNKINELHGIMADVTDENGNVIGRKEVDDSDNGWFIGKSIDEIWDYKIIGVWQEEEADEAAQYGLSPGDFKFYDANGNFRADDSDKQFLGSKVPLARLNMRNSFTFLKDFTFSFNLYSYLGHKKTFNRAKNNGALINTTNQIVTEYWSKDNPTNDYARLGSKNPDGVSFDVWRKADFVRLDNISLGYQVPKGKLERLKIQGLNLNVTAKNVAYLTNWPGEDPESSGNVPFSLVFGLNITF